MLKNAGIPMMKVIGPAPAPIARIKNNYRYRILIKVENAEEFFPILREINEEHNAMRGKNRLVIDVNPVNMM